MGAERRRWTVWLERVVMAAILAFVAVRLWPQVSAATGVGGGEAKAPDFAVRTLDGEWATSEDLRGQVVLVNFWATWCPPCRFEMPGFQGVYEDLRGSGFVILGIAGDAAEGPVREFVAERGVTYPIAMGDRSLERAFGGLTGIPTSFLIDRRGRVRHEVFGYFAAPALRLAARRLLDEELEEE